MKTKIISLFLFTLIFLMFSSCGEDAPQFILMSLDQEIELGQQVSDEFFANPDVIILDQDEYADAYTYIRGMLAPLLASDDVRFNAEFDYINKINIIHNDSVLNAFATPGGHIFVYTGLIKYLESEDELVGVLGHEIAHADRRHSAEVLQRVYGIQIITSILLGENPSELGSIVAALAGNLSVLSFTRSNESEADEYAVRYSADTEYSCTGVAGFFRKLEAEGLGCGAVTATEWLSTHPCPENRVTAIEEQAAALGCEAGYLSPDSYETFKSSLP